MNFLKPTLKIQDRPDPVFGTLKIYHQVKRENPDLKVINATLGSLVDEAGQLFTYETFYQQFKNLENQVHAAYAQDLVGNPDFLSAIQDWILADKITLKPEVLATPGGSGAIAAALTVFPESGEKVLVPEIAWSSYQLMSETRNLIATPYNLFNQANQFDLASFKKQVTEIIKHQKRLTIIINDPSHNPTGYSFGKELWQEIIEFLNSFENNSIVLINDIAYLDYTNDLEAGRNYLEVFNQVKPHLLIGLAVSLSKTLSAYGQCLGALITLSSNQDQHHIVKVALANYARATWSNVNNATMVAFSKLIQENKAAYIAENNKAVQLLKKRSQLFLKEAKEVELPIYPYHEGFFVTIKVNDNHFRDKYHQKLIENNIFTVPVNLGIRIALCGLTLPQIKGLAQKLAIIYYQNK